MLWQRSYKPTDGEIIYHYCGSQPFMSIIDSGRIRLSDVNMLNDYLEVKWGYRIFEAAATELLPHIPKDFFDKVDELVFASQLHSLPFIGCFSLAGDVLSQWRSYADDGKGYAIGFDAKLLTELPVRPLRINYDRKSQIAEMKQTLGALYQMAKDKNFDYKDKEWFEMCAFLCVDLCSFKNPTFEEEKEVRLAHLVGVLIDEKSIRLVDEGGVSQGQRVAGEEVGFRNRDGAIVAYIDLDYKKLGRAVREIVLGPRNPTAPTNVLIYLTNRNFTEVKIRHSAASYR
jgi:hypothetical protein